MGLDVFIPSMKKYPIVVIQDCCPEYKEHNSREDATRVLRHQYKIMQNPTVIVDKRQLLPSHRYPVLPKTIHQAPYEYVTSTKREELLIHTDPACKRMVIDDLMFALRAPKTIARAAGAKYTGLDFYRDLIYPIIAYIQIPSVHTITLVVDKVGELPEKNETREKRMHTQRRSIELANQRAANAMLTPAPVQKKRKHSGLDNNLRFNLYTNNEGETERDIEPRRKSRDDERSNDDDIDTNPTFRKIHKQSGAKRPQRRPMITDHRPKGDDDDGDFESNASNDSRHFEFPDDIEITDAGIQFKANGETRTLALDAARIMEKSSLRPKLYEYILKRLTNDCDIFDPNNLDRKTADVIFDFETAGPWFIRRGVAKRQPQARNNIIEADLACFWWAKHSKNHDIFIHANDTDYIAIALLNARLFNRSLVIQIRDRDPAVCMEAHLAKRNLEVAGVSAEEFVLGCIMCGTDFVFRSWYVFNLGLTPIRKGLALFNNLYHEWLNAFDSVVTTEPNHDTNVLHVVLTRLIQETIMGGGAVWEINTRPRVRVAPAWIQEILNTNSKGLDVLVCCIYLVYYHEKKKTGNLVIPALNLSTQMTRDGYGEILSRVFRQALEPMHTYRNRTNRETGEITSRLVGIPPWSDEKYQLALSRIKWNYNYWSTLQGTQDKQ